MRLKVRENSGMEVKFENECFTISLGEDLIETREQFLEHMGQIFDKAIYDSLIGGRGLRSNAMMIDEYSHIPNTVMMQMVEEEEEKYNTLREIADYMQKGSIGREILDNLK